MCKYLKQPPDPDNDANDRRDDMPHDFDDWNKCPSNKLIENTSKAIDEVKLQQEQNAKTVGELAQQVNTYITVTDLYQKSQNGHIRETKDTMKVLKKWLMVLAAGMVMHLFGVSSDKVYTFIIKMFGLGGV